MGSTPSVLEPSTRSPHKGAYVSTEPSNLSFLQHDISPPLSMIDRHCPVGMGLYHFSLPRGQPSRRFCLMPTQEFHCGHPCLGLRGCPQPLLPLWWALKSEGTVITQQLLAQLSWGALPIHQVDIGSASREPSLGWTSLGVNLTTSKINQISS